MKTTGGESFRVNLNLSLIPADEFATECASRAAPRPAVEFLGNFVRKSLLANEFSRAFAQHGISIGRGHMHLYNTLLQSAAGCLKSAGSAACGSRPGRHFRSDGDCIAVIIPVAHGSQPGDGLAPLLPGSRSKRLWAHGDNAARHQRLLPWLPHANPSASLRGLPALPKGLASVCAGAAGRVGPGSKRICRRALAPYVGEPFGATPCPLERPQSMRAKITEKNGSDAPSHHGRPQRRPRDARSDRAEQAPPSAESPHHPLCSGAWSARRSPAPWRFFARSYRSASGGVLVL